MGNSNQRKAETLGMPGGTANNRLRKKIIFALISEQLVAGNVCFVCKETIQTDDDMTIEHIHPWEGRENGKELFWDLSNIAFSHRWCNKPHIQGGGRPTIPLVHGTKSGYNKGCRCWECLADKRIQQENWRRGRRVLGLPVT